MSQQCDTMPPGANQSRFCHPRMGLEPAIVFVLALIVRLAFVVAIAPWRSPNPTAWEYGEIAANLVAGKGYSGGSWFGQESPFALMPPLYSFLMAGFYWLFGKGQLAYLLVELLQAVVGAATCVVLYHIAGGIFKNKQVAALSGGLLALYPIHAGLTIFHHPVTIYVFLELLSILWILRQAQRLSWRDSMVCGCLLGVAALADASAFVLLPCLLLWFFFKAKASLVTKLVHASVIILLILVVLFPWIVRNYLIFHELVLVRTLFGYHLWMGNNPNATGTHLLRPEPGQIEAVHMHTTLPPEILQRFRTMKETEIDRVFLQMALDYIRQHPASVLQLGLKKARYYFWFPDEFGRLVYWRDGSPMSGQPVSPYHYPGKVVWAMVLLPGLVGLVLSLRRHWPDTALPILIIAGYTALYAITLVGSNPRYRMPVDPLFIMFTAYTLRFLAIQSLPFSRGPMKLGESQTSKDDNTCHRKRWGGVKEAFP